VTAAADTIFALSSGAPPAAIAIIRVSGPAADEVAAAVAGAPLPPFRYAALRTFRAGDGEIIDRGLILRFPAGGSVTGEPMVELHTHGGRAVVERMLAELGRCPRLRLAEPGEFSRRALLGGRLSLVEAEALGDLLRAETERERRAALSVHDGAFGETLDRWRTRLIELSARVEQLVDHSDDVVAPIGEDQRLRSRVAELAEEMRVIINRPTRDSLRDGLTVALAGPPNAGKSSLLNELVGRNAALVSEHAGTTRDLIEVSIVIGGRRVRLIDTAGVRDSDDPVERMGIDLARRSLDTADLLIWLGDGPAPHRRGPTLSIRARCDDPSRRAPDGRLAVSSVTREGIDYLIDWIGEAAGGNVAGEAPALLNARQNAAVSTVYDELREATGQRDLILLAEHLRLARRALNGVATPADLESVMDRLFGDFCLGK
jgi:tRNA modification GTPase